MPNFWLSKRLDNISNEELTATVKKLMDRHDLSKRLSAWNSILSKSELVLAILTSPNYGLVGISLPSPNFTFSSEKVLKFAKGTPVKEVVKELVTQHYLALGYKA